MRLKFVSDGKFIEFDGFGEKDASVISVSGLEGVIKEYQTVRYVSVPGQVTLSESVLPREIVVTGDICLDKSRPFCDYCTFFAQNGELYVLRGTSKKKIRYKPVYFKRIGKKGNYILFELKIICDFPYFSDSVENEIEIYRRVNKVIGSFSLPKVFTERITEADIMNSGQIESAPVIVIECVDEGVFSGGIHIKNESTGKALVLEVNMSEGEKIVLDIKNCNISSNMRENCYGILSSQCALSDFVMAKGANEIVIENKNSGETVKVTICFENLYTEAV